MDYIFPIPTIAHPEIISRPPTGVIGPDGRKVERRSELLIILIAIVQYMLFRHHQV